MRNPAVFITLLAILLTSAIAHASLLPADLTSANSLPADLTSASKPPSATSRADALPAQLMGSPVYIQIFKEEGVLELYLQTNGQYHLLHSYPICKFSGGLGPKRLTGDLKSPEGFYAIDRRQLNPHSKFYKSMDIGFPNAYDRAHGYHGSYLMIHGACVSQGCYAMTDNGINEIYRYVNAALAAGQERIDVNIYPFRMTDSNMRRHKYASDLTFWRQLKPGYDYFIRTGKPPSVTVTNGRYVVSAVPDGKASFAQLQSGNPLSQVE